MIQLRSRSRSPLGLVVPLAMLALSGGAEARGGGGRPRTGDVVRVPQVARNVRPAAAAARAAGPATVTFYLDGRGGRIAGGVDDAVARRSWIAAEAPDGAVDVPAWGGSAAGWREVVRCVRAGFGGLAIEIVDQEPAGGDYTRIMVGGEPAMLGYPSWVAGVAPSGGGVLRRAVGFVFAAALEHDPVETCESVLHEAAHTLGLDHTMGCGDLMSYEQCGPKTFLDRSLPCGEGEARACQSGAQTQNSYRMLVDAVGLVGAGAPVTPPAGDGDAVGGDDAGDDGADDHVVGDATGDDATGDDATGDDATGDDATGDDATGGDDAAGDDDWLDDAAGDDGWFDDSSATDDDAADDGDDAADDTDDDGQGWGDLDGDTPAPATDAAADDALGDDSHRDLDEPADADDTLIAPSDSTLRFIGLPARARGERTLTIDVLAHAPAGIDDVLLVWQNGDERHAWVCSEPDAGDDVTCDRDCDHFRFHVPVGVGVRQLAALARDQAGAVWATAPHALELVR